MSTMTQTTVTSTGFCDGKLSDTNGFGFPHNSRSDAVSVLVGFHSAMNWSHEGSVYGGTNTFDMNVIGNSTVKIACWATSTVGTLRPR
jgi:hypothetical protein